MTLQTNLTTDAVTGLARSGARLYAARASGLHRSTDGGSTWHNTFASLDENLAATAVAALDQTVFAGTKGAVLRSDDTGNTWHISGLVTPPPLVVALAVSPNFAEDGTVLAGTAEDGVFVSTDRGDSWVPWNFSLLDLNVYALALSPNFAQDHTVYVGTESGIFRSSNGGRGWRELPFPMDVAPVLALGVSANGTIYAGTEENGLYVSTDGGSAWTQLKASGSVQALDVSAALTVLLPDQLWHSTDGGQSWSEHRFATAESALTLLPDGDSVFVGWADGAIARVTP
ncbi:MAG: hypothetical protein J0M07_27095 [Anaerolineae bacterium]|nr:hypothetical protein [Anaerolineae bacterium]